jgi:hypothetical protein
MMPSLTISEPERLAGRRTFCEYVLPLRVRCPIWEFFRTVAAIPVIGKCRSQQAKRIAPDLEVPNPFHAAPAVVGRIAREAGVGRLIVSHISQFVLTRTWLGIALCSSIISILPGVPMAASGQVYPRLQ